MRMPISPRVGPILTFAFVLLASFIPSVQAQEQETYHDDRYDFKLIVSKPWEKAALSHYQVPGTARAAWSGKNSSSIVAFVQEPDRALTPRFLLDASAKALEIQLKAKILEKEVKKVGGKQAMWLYFEGKGTGGAVTGNGDVLTTQHWVAIPRDKEVIVLLLTCPSADYKELKTSFEKAVEGFEIGGKQTEEQQASK